MRRKASEIPKAELVKMIAQLRGVLHVFSEDDWEGFVMDHRHEIEDVLEKTTFDDDLNETYSDYESKGGIPWSKAT